jgi:hypothetical protein
VEMYRGTCAGAMGGLVRDSGREVRSNDAARELTAKQTKPFSGATIRDFFFELELRWQ